MQAGFDMDLYLDWRRDGHPNGYNLLLRNTDTPMEHEGDSSGSVRPRLTRKACSPKTRLFDCAERSNKRVEISLLQRQIDDSVQMCKQAFF